MPTRLFRTGFRLIAANVPSDEVLEDASEDLEDAGFQSTNVGKLYILDYAEMTIRKSRLDTHGVSTDLWEKDNHML